MRASITEAEALERAADVAREEGDLTHERDLRYRAKRIRRAAREQDAGVQGWPTMIIED